jgi:molybdopterin adenylyltransferase
VTVEDPPRGETTAERLLEALPASAGPAPAVRGRSGFVLTVSDRSARGERGDASGPALAERLAAMGYQVETAIVPDEEKEIARAVREAATEHVLVVTTGGTGMGPRDVTPQALRAVVDYEVPGFGEAMRSDGRTSTPFAILSRSFGAVIGRTLVLALPGSPRGALESLAAVAGVLQHAVEMLETPLHERPAT